MTILEVPWAIKNGQQIPLFLLYLAIATSASRIFEVWLLRLHGPADQISLSRLSRTVLYGCGWFLGVMAFWISNGYTFLSISTGALAAGFAFAAQRTMGDLIAGIALSIEGAYRFGDWLSLSDGTQGQVINIDWRATHLRGWDNAMRVIPNTIMTSQSLVKLPKKAQTYAQTYPIRISGVEEPEKVIQALEAAVEAAGSVLEEPQPAIRLADATTEPYKYTLWVHFRNYLEMFAGRDELFRMVHSELSRVGIEISPATYQIRASNKQKETQ
ncbi:mechanosensitive ion channel family protein [Ruegeria sp. HKCCD7318]|uniref:mechanosensitive ion channel domain-containing protein n=1 Tax=Ruegeria sp. HKCCD7318 TaxID=2683014 RepID=UPI001490AFC1|nr:mechanosensitive ion channel family protein [Ruegeria sp. HKCCD7318]NOE36321.1 mechanosensitive ion channel [Ruegeria sp. HKCCD7318]